MKLLVVGTVAFDSVKTPFGEVNDVLGGSATYFSVSASYFTDVSIVAVVGEDFPDEHLEMLRQKEVDVRGVMRSPGKTFRWKGEYGSDLNQANTLETQLNVLADFSPVLPEEYTDCNFVFLANVDPVLQSKVLDQIKKPIWPYLKLREAIYLHYHLPILTHSMSETGRLPLVIPLGYKER